MRISYLFYEPILDLAELELRLGVLATLGYRGVELSAAPALIDQGGQIAALAAAHGLPVVSLLSGWSYAHESLCLSSPEASIRRRAVARLSDHVGLAARLGSIVVVGLMQGLRSDEPDATKANERIVAGLSEVARVAEPQGVSVVIEPVNHLQVGFNHTVAEVLELVGRVGSPALGYMLDTFHLNIEERSPLGTIREHAADARHIHLCETSGGPFGTGHLDFGAVLAALRAVGYDRDVSVKVYRQAPWDEAARASAGFLERQGYPISRADPA